MVAEKAAWSAEDTKAERMAEFVATFTTNDTDNDGFLNRAEFENFITALGQNSAARNLPVLAPEGVPAEMKDKFYALFDDFNKESVGVS